MDEDPELAAAIAASLEQMNVEEQIRQIEKNTGQNVNQEEEKKEDALVPQQNEKVRVKQEKDKKPLVIDRDYESSLSDCDDEVDAIQE